MPDLRPRTLLSLARRAVVFELRLYWSLLRWVARRPDLPSGAEVVTYHRTVTPVLWLWIFASAVEVPLVHVLIPWDTVRIIALAVSVWGLLWMVGFLASLTVHPHLLGESELRIRHGATLSLAVPLESVAAVTTKQQDLPSSVRTLQPRETEDGVDLRIGVSGQVNVHAVLAAPLTVPTAKGDLRVTELSFWADDPRALVAAVRQRITADR